MVFYTDVFALNPAAVGDYSLSHVYGMHLQT